MNRLPPLDRFEQSSLERADWDLLVSGPVLRYADRDRMASRIGSLRELGYHVVELDVSEVGSTAEFHDMLPAAFDFPDCPGRNLDCFLDHLRDLKHAQTLIVLWGFDQLLQLDSDWCAALLDVCCWASWDHLVHGQFVGTLVHAVDWPRGFPAVGARGVDGSSA